MSAGNGIGLNLRCSYKLSQGGRKYMEDVYVTKFLEDEEGVAQLAFFAVYDGHGGRDAAEFAKQRLLQEITSQDLFWSDSDEDVLKAIRIGFRNTHDLMWREIGKWPKTWSGLPSTAGTTASVAIIRDSKLYIGHVGDSAIVLGCHEQEDEPLAAKRLTEDHKPESPEEKKRIEEMGGHVISGKSGVLRVVWNRPGIHHKGPIRRSTPMEQIPFLAVARSLGDLWSYNFLNGDYAVSPDPDVYCMPLDPKKHKCLILGSDGLWNMMTPQEAVSVVEQVEKEIENKFLRDPDVNENYWINPSTRLVDIALMRWSMNNMRADNTTAITVMIDPYGPRKSEILLRQRKQIMNRIRREKRKSENKCSDSSRQSGMKTHGKKTSFHKIIPVLSKLDVALPVGSDVFDSSDTPMLDVVDGPIPDKPASDCPSTSTSAPHNKPYGLTRVSNISVPSNITTLGTPVSSWTVPMPALSPRSLRNKPVSQCGQPNETTSDEKDSDSQEDVLPQDSRLSSLDSLSTNRLSGDSKIMRSQSKTSKCGERPSKVIIGDSTLVPYSCENSVKKAGGSKTLYTSKKLDSEDCVSPRRITRGLLKDSALAQNVNQGLSSPASAKTPTVRHVKQLQQANKPVQRVTRQTPSKMKFTNLKRKINDSPSPNLRRKKIKMHAN